MCIHMIAIHVVSTNHPHLFRWICPKWCHLDQLHISSIFNVDTIHILQIHFCILFSKLHNLSCNLRLTNDLNCTLSIFYTLILMMVIHLNNRSWQKYEGAMKRTSTDSIPITLCCIHGLSVSKPNFLFADVNMVSL